MGNYKHLIIHCTATPASRQVTPVQIQMWHMGPRKNADGTINYKGKVYASIKQLPFDTFKSYPIRTADGSKLLIRGRGWNQVGYSKLFHQDGTIDELIKHNDDDYISPWEVSNGAFNYNQNSKHWVFAGGLSDNLVPENTLTDECSNTLYKHITAELTQHPQIIILGHRDLNKTGCPGFNVAEWIVSKFAEFPKQNLFNK